MGQFRFLYFSILFYIISLVYDFTIKHNSFMKSSFNKIYNSLKWILYTLLKYLLILFSNYYFFSSNILSSDIMLMFFINFSKLSNVINSFSSLNVPNIARILYFTLLFVHTFMHKMNSLKSKPSFLSLLKIL